MSKRTSAGKVTHFSTRLFSAERGNVLSLLLLIFHVDDRLIVRFRGGSDTARVRRGMKGERFKAANSSFVSAVVARLLNDCGENSSTDAKPLESDSFVCTDSIDVLSGDLSNSEKPDSLSLNLLQSDMFDRLESLESASLNPRRLAMERLFQNWENGTGGPFFLGLFKSNVLAAFCRAFSDNSSNCNLSLAIFAFPALAIIWTSIKVISSSLEQSRGIFPLADTEHVSAPRWNNSSANNLSPISAAMWRGVRPCLSFAFTFTPLSSRIDTRIKLPSWDALCKANIMWQVYQSHFSSPQQIKKGSRFFSQDLCFVSFESDLLRLRGFCFQNRLFLVCSSTVACPLSVPGSSWTLYTLTTGDDLLW